MICDVIWYCLFYFVQRVQIERLQTMIYNGDDENTIGENKKEKTRNLKLKTQNPKTILIVTKQKNDDKDNNLITSITKQIRIV